MFYENNFRVLGDRAIVDPILKVVVSMGRMHWEEEGWQEINISYNPELTLSVLERIYEWEATDPKQRSQHYPGYSDKAFSFFQFTLRKITEGQNLVLELLGPDEEFQRANLGSVQRGNLYECSDRKAFLLYIFKNVLLIPELQEWGFGKYTKVQLKISAVKLALLEGRATENLSGDVILDERDVGAAL